MEKFFLQKQNFSRPVKRNFTCKFSTTTHKIQPRLCLAQHLDIEKNVEGRFHPKKKIFFNFFLPRTPKGPKMPLNRSNMQNSDFWKFATGVLKPRIMFYNFIKNSSMTFLSVEYDLDYWIWISCVICKVNSKGIHFYHDQLSRTTIKSSNDCIWTSCVILQKKSKGQL